ncbi:MAG: DUF4176 domain-containing protein [Bacilli bacterium]|nr:DUF4176 domain-containing protein [Bacilli bacterium]
MNEEFLPLGSIVLLKGGTVPVVVIGYTVIEEGSSELWDYLGCAYPIGVMDPERNLLFKRNQIEKVLFVGYIDDDGKKFLNQLTESYKKITENQ